MKRAFRAVAVLPWLVLASCSGSGAPGATASAASGDAGAVAEADPARTGLAVYVGKYPFDEVNGSTWENNRQVTDGVKSTVSDPAIAARVLDYTGPATPIAMVDGKVVAGVCEAHNCGDHNWEIFIHPDGSGTEVCYYDADKTPGWSVWYLPGGKIERREGPCSIE